MIESKRFRRARSAAVAIGGALLLALAGCTGGAAMKPSAAQKGGSSAAAEQSATALFRSFAQTLNGLEDHIVLDLHPPEVVLDATTSRNGQTILATLTDHPRQPTGHNNYLRVWSNDNAQFTRGRNDVKPGDRIRLYAKPDDSGYGKIDYFDMTVQQVLSSTELIIAGELNMPVLAPTRMEVWRYSTTTLEEINQKFMRYAALGQPALAWEPSPDEPSLRRMIDLLNQWQRGNSQAPKWERDPLADKVAEPYAPFVTAAVLGATSFEPYDARLLQEAVWLRDVSNWTLGRGRRDDSEDASAESPATTPRARYKTALDEATALFDWTVQHVQLQPEASYGGRRHRPWQTLLYGHGTAEERAWVFVLLARQQGLPVVIVAPAAGEKKKGKWLAAFYEKQQLYLFDPALGLPIPGPEGRPVATLAEAAADDAILRRLDLDAKKTYPWSAADLQKVGLFIEGSPFALSRRAAAVETGLAAEESATLIVRPTELAKELAALPQTESVALWDLPFRTHAALLEMASGGKKTERQRQIEAIEYQTFAMYSGLFKARVLHFQGRLQGDRDGARFYYRGARKSDEEINSPDNEPAERFMLTKLKQQASYFLGLMAADAGEREVAVDFLDGRTLKATPRGFWTPGARYNLARVQEAAGRRNEAVRLLEQGGGEQDYGNRLRAKWLREQSEPKAEKKAEPKAEPTAEKKAEEKPE